MFSKKSDAHQNSRPAEPEIPPMATRNNNSSTFSVLGSDVTIRGDVEATADLHIDGMVEGDIKCASLVQGESSHVTGGIEAENARLAGKVTGSIKARELVILKSARIDGDVHYDALTIEQGAQVEGRFAHSIPQRRAADAAPAKPKAPEASAEGNGSGDEPKLSLAG